MVRSMAFSLPLACCIGRNKIAIFEIHEHLQAFKLPKLKDLYTSGPHWIEKYLSALYSIGDTLGCEDLRVRYCITPGDEVSGVERQL